MKIRTLMRLGVVGLCLALPVATWAADPMIDDLTLGKHVCGEKWTLEALKGRTVLVFFWDLG
ncbi:MAG: hypothetical protein ACYS47_04935 [Planctomycetota bacterium]